MTRPATTTITDISTKLTAILDAWDSRTLTDQHAADLARLTNEHLSVRDAFIVHIIAPDTSRDTIMDAALHPHRPDMVTFMGHTLTREFTGGHVDTQRLAQEGANVAGIVQRVPDDIPCAQLETIAAYLLWWGGDTHAAMTHALTALAIDETCSLAAIVIGAVRRDIMPM